MAGLFGESVKTAFLKGIEAIGKGASTLAEGAQNKLNEINLEPAAARFSTRSPSAFRNSTNRALNCLKN